MTALATTPLPLERDLRMVLLKGGQTGEPMTPDARATALMDLYRQTRSREVFDALVELTHDQLLARVNARVRFLDPAVDPRELLQDAFINIYRYPDRFDASRPGAFRAWSTTIVDNSVRRYLRKERSGPDVRLKPMEILAQEPDLPMREPSEQAILGEQCQTAREVFGLFLAMYLGAFQHLLTSGIDQHDAALAATASSAAARDSLGLPRQRVGQRHAPYRRRKEFARQARGRVGHAQPQLRRRSEGVALHVIDIQRQVLAFPAAANIAVGLVAAAVDAQQAAT